MTKSTDNNTEHSASSRGRLPGVEAPLSPQGKQESAGATHRRGLLALSPLMVFIAIYLVSSLVAGDFYKMPITVAFMVSSIYAVAVSRGWPLAKRIQAYSRGAGTENMMLMLWIFVLAGAFAQSAKQMGSIDATVALTLEVLPPRMLFAGLFLASCFISLSIGTSVGTIVALTPIAAGIASQTGLSCALVTAIVVGGSFFGDNLSFISDTTVVATRTQGCRMSDKFRVNAFITLPVAAVLLAVYVAMGSGVEATPGAQSVDYLKIVPYLVVLATAVCGMNVMAVLTLGILLTGAIGIGEGTYDVYGWAASMGEGITGMGELIIITMMAGGMLEIVRMNGGIDYVIRGLSARVHGKRGAELTVAFLVGLVDICTANNTVAIITVGDISKRIGDRYGVDSRKAASILDTVSCGMQGLIPYGAQMLMAAGLASLNPVEIIPYLYYPAGLLVATLAAILFRYPRRYS